MPFKPVIYLTDALFFLLIITAMICVFYIRKREHLREPWQRVWQNKLAVIAATIVSFYVLIAFLDSLHFQKLLPDSINNNLQYSAQVYSVLDLILDPAGENDEKTYSAPFATHLYNKETEILPDGKTQQVFPKLAFAARDVNNQNSRPHDIASRALWGFLIGLGVWLAVFIFYKIIIWLKQYSSEKNSNLDWASFFKVVFDKTNWSFWLTILGLAIFTFICLSLIPEYHLLGTDKVGQDTFYQTFKSIRTGLMIGTLTTLVMLPFAILLGTSAGYFGGIADDIIQYVYTTLSSIPGVLLIAASVLSLQIFISNHPDLFSTIGSRADARLFALCLILGVTSWTSLCRLLRGETLKVRELDYIQAAKVMGAGHLKIIMRHIIPNIWHIVLITVVLDFSGLVLAEAVLTYVGVGVDPTTMSWGNMINSARLELAREPVVWWPLAAAFIFMFILVLAANLFADAVRDAFDPRIRIGN